MAVETPRRLLDFSDDVLRLIFLHNVGLKDLKSLRLTHPGFHSSVDPLLFKTVTIALPVYLDGAGISENSGKGDQRAAWGRDFMYFPAMRDLSPETSTYQISCILERRAPRFLLENTQEIILKRYDLYKGYPDGVQMQTNFSDYCEEGINGLEAFICGMKKLRSLTWSIPYSNITQLIDLSPVSGGIKSLSLTSTYCKIPKYSYKAFRPFTSLTSLELFYYVSGDIKDLSYFPNLNSLKFNALHALEADFEGSFDFVDFLGAQRVPFRLQTLSMPSRCASVPIPRDLAERFLSNLHTLHLSGIMQEAKSCRLMDALIENSIGIRHLNIEGSHPDVIKYLTSYTDTLQSLEIFVQCAKDNEGFDNGEEDYWRYAGSRSRWGEDLLAGKIKTFKSDVWKLAVAAHRNSLESLILADNFHFYKEDTEILSQCKVLKKMNIKGDDWVFSEIVSAASHLPSLELVEFEIPWIPRKPDMSGWCGTAQFDWHMKPKDVGSRIRAMHWLEDNIKGDNQLALGNISFRVFGIETDLKLVRRQDRSYPWILVGGGDMGIEGREGYIDSDEDGELESDDDGDDD
ncbi:hypothetical protein TWF718_001093 [Orbilia javanica]|uniref:F-box domain-containing protein n=1 Tax=Orbilia javanica TaxID=47235 RepID=A0AAN8N089_9PEZI